MDSPGALATGFLMGLEELGKIDPDWRSHAEMRWAARPADVVDRKETASKNS